MNRPTAYWNDHGEGRAEIILRCTNVPAAVSEQIVLGEPRTEISDADVRRQIERARGDDLMAKTVDAREVLAK